MPTPVPRDLQAKYGKPAFFLTYTMDNNIRRSPEEGCHTIRKRRRDKGQSNEKLDNSWVMPYSPYLLKRFRCLINLEYCATVLSVKYQFPYTIEERLLKRFRCLINLKYCATVLSVKYLFPYTIEKRDMTDEIKKFQTRRYVSGREPVYRFAEFPMSEIIVDAIEEHDQATVDLDYDLRGMGTLPPI